MVANPEEGRLSPEKQTELLRESRKRTVEMRREYRSMRNEAEAKKKASRWAANHRKSQEKVYEDLEKAATGRKLNRAQRRHFAKRMNVFKTPDGWKHFSSNFKKKFGDQQTITRVKNAPRKEPRSNIQQALAAAKVTPKEDK